MHNAAWINMQIHKYILYRIVYNVCKETTYFATCFWSYGRFILFQIPKTWISLKNLNIFETRRIQTLFRYLEITELCNPQNPAGSISRCFTVHATSDRQRLLTPSRGSYLQSGPGSFSEKYITVFVISWTSKCPSSRDVMKKYEAWKEVAEMVGACEVV